MIWGSAVMALEEPKYTIIKQTNDYEIRKYDDRLAVETLEGSGENRAFSLLFKYISGANELNSKVAMTIPVTQSTKIDNNSLDESRRGPATDACYRQKE